MQQNHFWLHFTNWVLCQKHYGCTRPHKGQQFASKGHAEKKASMETKCFAANSHNINHNNADHDWFPLISFSFIWPKRCGALGTILGMRREKLREALALSRAKTKVDLSRVTDSIESCIWRREAVLLQSVLLQCPSGAVEQPQCCIAKLFFPLSQCIF